MFHFVPFVKKFTGNPPFLSTLRSQLMQAELPNNSDPGHLINPFSILIEILIGLVGSGQFLGAIVATAVFNISCCFSIESSFSDMRKHGRQ